jgi:hypothetical protein
MPSCILETFCYNNKCQGERETKNPKKKNSKKSQKTLDKQNRKCYNESTKGERKQSPQASKKNQKKKKKRA